MAMSDSQGIAGFMWLNQGMFPTIGNIPSTDTDGNIQGCFHTSEHSSRLGEWLTSSLSHSFFYFDFIFRCAEILRDFDFGIFRILRDFDFQFFRIFRLFDFRIFREIDFEFFGFFRLFDFQFCSQSFIQKVIKNRLSTVLDCAENFQGLEL